MFSGNFAATCHLCRQLKNVVGNATEALKLLATRKKFIIENITFVVEKLISC